MRISDWSSDVCSSDLKGAGVRIARVPRRADTAAGAMKWMGTDMRKLAAVLFVVAAWLVLGGSAWAAVEVELIETWPAGDAVTIGTNQNYSLRIARTEAGRVGKGGVGTGRSR